MMVHACKSLSSQGSTVYTWARRTRQTRRTESTTVPLFPRRLSLSDLTHTRTIGSGGRLTRPVSLSHVSRAVRTILLYPKTDALSVQVNVRDDLFDRQNQFVMGGSPRTTRRAWGTTTTTFSAGGEYHHSHSYSEIWSTTMTDATTRTYGEPLTKQLLRCWLAHLHTFLLVRTFFANSHDCVA